MFRKVKYLFIFLLLSGCIGASSPGVFGTGVTVAIDPRSLGTQIDDSIMDKSLEARILKMNKIKSTRWPYIFNWKSGYT